MAKCSPITPHGVIASNPLTADKSTLGDYSLLMQGDRSLVYFQSAVALSSEKLVSQEQSGLGGRKGRSPLWPCMPVDSATEHLRNGIAAEAHARIAGAKSRGATLRREVHPAQEVLEAGGKLFAVNCTLLACFHQRKFSTSMMLLAAMSRWAYRIQRPSGETLNPGYSKRGTLSGVATLVTWRVAKLKDSMSYVLAL